MMYKKYVFFDTLFYIIQSWCIWSFSCIYHLSYIDCSCAFKESPCTFVIAWNEFGTISSIFLFPWKLDMKYLWLYFNFYHFDCHFLLVIMSCQFTAITIYASVSSEPGLHIQELIVMPALVPGLFVLWINKKQDPVVECNSIIIPIYFMNLVIYFW